MAGNRKIPLSKVMIDDEMKKEVIRALESGWYILGERTREFESAFAKFCGVKYAVATSSGTTAIFLSLLALGIGRGDEVIVPSLSFIATATPIIHVGARPVFVDIDLTTYTMDPEHVRRVLKNRKHRRRVRAIMPVHLYGHPADMDPLLELAEEHNLFVIEDACQAHGALYKGRKVGSIGHVACFSFYPSKNMTVCGDGGMVVTNDEELAEKIRMLRNHGRREKYLHEIIGYNMRFNELQAAIGLVQLRRLPKWNERRREIASLYNEALDGLVITPKEAPWAKHVYHMYVIRAEHRDKLRAFLADKGISTGIHYPIPIHKQPAIVSQLGELVSLKNTELCARTVLSLPMYPGLREEDVRYICDEIRRFFESSTHT